MPWFAACVRPGSMTVKTYTEEILPSDGAACLAVALNTWPGGTWDIVFLKGDP